MTLSLEVRRAHWARFVNRALDRAKLTRKWSVARVSKETGISEAEIYRWKAGDTGKGLPPGERVEQWCSGLGIPASLAFGILWPESQTGMVDPGEGAAEPLTVHPSIDAIMRKLADPRTSEKERYLINETLDALAARYAQK